MSGGDRFRGKISKAQLGISIKLAGLRSKKVVDYLTMYYVNGVVIPDIVSYTGCAGGNIHRDITKVARVLNFVELYIEYGRLNNG